MTTPKPKVYTRKAVYTGRRMSGGKVWQRFELLPEKTEMFFRGVKRVYIGATYKCNRTSIAGKPERIDDEMIFNAEWDAADALVDAHNAEKRAEAKYRAKASPALKNAVEALRPLVRGIGFFDAKALTDYLVTEAKKKK